jgi:hypothetical protein
MTWGFGVGRRGRYLRRAFVIARIKQVISKGFDNMMIIEVGDVLNPGLLWQYALPD